MKLLKKEIKSLIEKNDQVNFISTDYRGDWQQDTVSRDGEYFAVISKGQNWSDQVSEKCDLARAVNFVWSSRPHEII